MKSLIFFVAHDFLPCCKFAMTALKPQNAAGKENTRKHKPRVEGGNISILIERSKNLIHFLKIHQKCYWWMKLKSFPKKHQGPQPVHFVRQKSELPKPNWTEKNSASNAAVVDVFSHEDGRKGWPFFVAHFQVIIRKYEK